MSESHPKLEAPSLLRRFAVMNYDSLLLMAVSMAYGIAYIGLAKLLFGMTADNATGPLFQIGWLLTLLGFFCYFWTKGGQTTGMRAWRLKIIDGEGKPPRLMSLIIRFFLAPLGWLLFFTAFFDKQKRCLHDIASHTRLILLAKEKK